jgi:N-acetylglucosamine-6-phosphate deacetylase
VLPRHPNYIWEQLANDDLYASIITDGHHLPPSVVKCIVRVKSTSRTIVTCDASSLAGKPPGRYRHWGQDLEVLESGKIVVPGTPYLAGSGSFTDTCVSNLITFADTSLYHAINMAGAIPRRLFRLPPVEVMTGPGPILLFEWTRDQPIRVLNVIP